MTDKDGKKRRGNLRLAIILALLAIAVYVGFIVINMPRGDG
jgi:hypothetical protein